jgi:hypothetical protein
MLLVPFYLTFAYFKDEESCFVWHPDTILIVILILMTMTLGFGWEITYTVDYHSIIIMHIMSTFIVIKTKTVLSTPELELEQGYPETVLDTIGSNCTKGIFKRVLVSDVPG